MPKRPPNIAILAEDGALIANRGDTGGAAVRLGDLPPYLPKAFIAIEDRRFYSHFGIDPIGISRAIGNCHAAKGNCASFHPGIKSLTIVAQASCLCVSEMIPPARINTQARCLCHYRSPHQLQSKRRTNQKILLAGPVACENFFRDGADNLLTMRRAPLVLFGHTIY